MTSKQEPIQSGFGMNTTAREALAGRDLTGRIAIVTGGYSGVGLETARVLAGAGATVIVPARRPDTAREPLAGIPRVELEAMDLGDPASIGAFAERFLASGRPLHILANVAGIMACPLTRDARGYESQLAVNHIGHFDLTARLGPALAKANGARVVSVSSRGHRRAGVDFEDPQFTRRAYDKWVAYGQSKTANILFALALDARGEKHGVRAFSLHPGAINTNLSRHVPTEELQALRERLKGTTQFKTAEQGAATVVWCAVSQRLDGMGGVYCEDVEVARQVAADDPGDLGVRPWATDPALAERLWALSEEWTGRSFKP